MEKGKKQRVTLLPSSSNKPPISPKPFTLIPSSTTLPLATGSFEGWQKPYFMSHDGAGSSSGTTKPYPNPNPSCFLNCPPHKKHEIQPLLFKNNPVTTVAPLATNNRGITVSTGHGIDYALTEGRNLDLNMDERKLKRILSNRIAAKNFRLRKAQYVCDLKKKLNDLQAQFAVLNLTIESERERNKIIQRENILLKEAMGLQVHKDKLSLAQLEENQAEVKRSDKLYAARKRRGLDLNQVAGELDLSLNLKSLTINP